MFTLEFLGTELGYLTLLTPICACAMSGFMEHYHPMPFFL